MLPLSWLAAAALLAAPAPLDRISSAERCGRCHRDILQAWKTSLHAQALEDPIFQDALDQAEEQFGTMVRSECLRCHAPTVQHSDDDALHTKVSWEGVTCDFCHSLKTVTLEGGTPRLTVGFDGVKTGPLKEAVPAGHRVAFSPIYTSSLICAGCHEYRNPAGLAVLTTYSEWQNSSYAKEGKNCQDCHMSNVAAKVVDPKVLRIPQTTVNLHQMPGSHSIDQLNKAVAARLTTAREAGSVRVHVELENRGAGHMVPTGSPLRQLRLEVRVDANDGKDHRASRTYRRLVVDGQGKEVAEEQDGFVRGARVKEDTRLRPGERRTEVFEFPVTTPGPARVQARLSYYYSPLARTAAEQSLNFLVLTQYAPAQSPRPR